MKFKPGDRVELVACAPYESIIKCVDCIHNGRRTCLNREKFGTVLHGREGYPSSYEIKWDSVLTSGGCSEDLLRFVNSRFSKHKERLLAEV